MDKKRPLTRDWYLLLGIGFACKPYQRFPLARGNINIAKYMNFTKVTLKSKVAYVKPF